MKIFTVIPAQAGIQSSGQPPQRGDKTVVQIKFYFWIPARAGMTNLMAACR
jgi:hypothetical protein